MTTTNVNENFQTEIFDNGHFIGIVSKNDSFNDYTAVFFNGGTVLELGNYSSYLIAENIVRNFNLQQE